MAGSHEASSTRKTRTKVPLQGSHEADSALVCLSGSPEANSAVDSLLQSHETDSNLGPNSAFVPMPASPEVNSALGIHIRIVPLQRSHEKDSAVAPLPHSHDPALFKAAARVPLPDNYEIDPALESRETTASNSDAKAKLYPKKTNMLKKPRLLKKPKFRNMAIQSILSFQSKKVSEEDLNQNIEDGKDSSKSVKGNSLQIAFGSAAVLMEEASSRMSPCPLLPTLLVSPSPCLTSASIPSTPVPAILAKAQAKSLNI